MSMIEMPQYKCHKKVWALKIDGVVSNPNGSVDLFFVEKGYAPVNLEGKSADREWAAGGYYVVYEDGYTSFSPAKAFEDGYTLADKEEPLGELGSDQEAYEQTLKEFAEQLEEVVGLLGRKSSASAAYSSGERVQIAINELGDLAHSWRACD